MVPVNPHVTIKLEQTLVVGQTVSPTAATKERARSEFSEAIHDGAPYVSLDIKGSKLQHSVISKPVVKRNSPQRMLVNTQVPLLWTKRKNRNKKTQGFRIDRNRRRRQPFLLKYGVPN